MLNSIIETEITLPAFLICTGVSFALGICNALVNMFKTRCTQSFAVTLAVLPAIVQLVIMLVNGNIGAGVAVAGTFSLVRFRSAQGTAREISSIFLAMAIGLATGMGYVTLAVLFFTVVAVVLILLTLTSFGKQGSLERVLRITIPENLDYDGLFDDLFQIYVKNYSLDKVKTTNMGTLYELEYHITLKDNLVPKAFLDEIRCRNGNLNIVCGKEISCEQL